MKIELIIRCDECGNKLNISRRESDPNIIFVSPCDTCGEEEYQGGYASGQYEATKYE